LAQEKVTESTPETESEGSEGTLVETEAEGGVEAGDGGGGCVDAGDGGGGDGGGG
jgi:hypothetical protein